MAFDYKLIGQVKEAVDRVRVVLPYEDQYLMETLQNPKWPQNIGKRRFIGGGIDEGETPEQAATRELMEELGAKIDSTKFKYLGLDPKETAHKLHYLQLDDHGLKPGKYKATVGSDPFIHLNKGLPSGDDYTGPELKTLIHSLAKEAANTVFAMHKLAGNFIPKPADKNVHPPIPGKATGQANPFPSSGTIIQPSPNFASGLQTLKIPKGFTAESPELRKFVASNYYPESPGPRNSMSGHYSPNARNSNYLAIHKNVSSPEQQDAMALESRRLANIGLQNRAGRSIAFNNSPEDSSSQQKALLMGATSEGDFLGWEDKTRKLVLDSRTQRLNENSNTKIPFETYEDGYLTPHMPQGAIVAHELEHAGAQRGPTISEKLDEINRENRRLGLPLQDAESLLSQNPFLSRLFTLRKNNETEWSKNNLTVGETAGPVRMFRGETPAVLAEMANQAQSAYVANDNKPLSGHFSVDPTGRFKIPLEEFRKQVERRGHVGGNHNVSMTDLLNSPEGQEFLRMNMQNAKITERIAKERADNIWNTPSLYNTNTWPVLKEDKQKQGPDYQEKQMLGWNGISTRGQFRGY
jgi:8-oxo-dGTP pyrophosphatase MutT (NUDIX family)